MRAFTASQLSAAVTCGGSDYGSILAAMTGAYEGAGSGSRPLNCAPVHPSNPVSRRNDDAEERAMAEKLKYDLERALCFVDTLAGCNIAPWRELGEEIGPVLRDIQRHGGHIEGIDRWLDETMARFLGDLRSADAA
jgi:hypothetical protein